MNAILASADVAIQTIEGATAVGIERIVIQEPWVRALGLVENGFDQNLVRLSEVLMCYVLSWSTYCLLAYFLLLGSFIFTSS